MTKTKEKATDPFEGWPLELPPGAKLGGVGRLWKEFGIDYRKLETLEELEAALALLPDSESDAIN